MRELDVEFSSLGNAWSLFQPDSKVFFLTLKNDNASEQLVTPCNPTQTAQDCEKQGSRVYPISQIAKRSLVAKVVHQVNSIRESSRILTSTFWTFQYVVCILKQEAAEICYEKGSILGSNPTMVPRRPHTHKLLPQPGASKQTNMSQKSTGSHRFARVTLDTCLFFYNTMHTHSTKCCREKC